MKKITRDSELRTLISDPLAVIAIFRFRHGPMIWGSARSVASLARPVLLFKISGPAQPCPARPAGRPARADLYRAL